MSTKGSIASVDLTEVVGKEKYHAHIHLYHECFDKAPQPVYLEVWQQGVWSNQNVQMVIPCEKALELADQLAAWAAKERNWRKQQ